MPVSHVPSKTFTYDIHIKSSLMVHIVAKFQKYGSIFFFTDSWETIFAIAYHKYQSDFLFIWS